MAEGFQDPLQLAGVWLAGSTSVLPDTVGGFRDVYSLAGVILPGLVGTASEPEPVRLGRFKPCYRPRRGR